MRWRCAGGRRRGVSSEQQKANAERREREAQDRQTAEPCRLMALRQRFARRLERDAGSGLAPWAHQARARHTVRIRLVGTHEIVGGRGSVLELDRRRRRRWHHCEQRDSGLGASHRRNRSLSGQRLGPRCDRSDHRDGSGYGAGRTGPQARAQSRGRPDVPTARREQRVVFDLRCHRLSAFDHCATLQSASSPPLHQVGGAAAPRFGRRRALHPRGCASWAHNDRSHGSAATIRRQPMLRRAAATPRLRLPRK